MNVNKYLVIPTVLLSLGLVSGVSEASISTISTQMPAGATVVAARYYDHHGARYRVVHPYNHRYYRHPGYHRYYGPHKVVKCNCIRNGKPACCHVYYRW